MSIASFESQEDEADKIISSSLLKHPAKKRDHIGECLVCGFRVVARAYVAHESVFGIIKLLRKIHSCLSQSRFNFGASL
jgi:hypothetical protein